MTASITLPRSPELLYLLRVADTCLIHSHRLSEWCGHAPVLEEDIALTNMALDLLGQARALLSLAGQRAAANGHAEAFDEDRLAYLRDERDFFNLTLAELPNGPEVPGDFAFTVLRNHALATWFVLLWERLAQSSDADVAAIAAKALKEARYHEAHTADWVVRLGDGTDESAARMRAALKQMWPYVAEMFAADEVDAAGQAARLGPSCAELREPWMKAVTAVYARARLEAPAATKFLSTGRRGVHSEHMGYILATMQHLQRSYPGGAW